MATYNGTGDAETYGGTTDDDIVNMAGGDDTAAGGAGADTMDGGDGQDLLDYTASTAGVMADLSRGRGRGGDADGDRFSGFEDIAGSVHNDTLIGDAGDNRLMGGNGFDFFDGGAGADYIHGGGDQDRVNYGASGEAVRVSLDTGRGYTGDAEGDVLIRIEELVGSNYNDTLEGSTGRNKFWGGGGDDLITANDGPDVLYGEAGDDTLIGGEGRDILIGGAGIDTADYSASGAAVTVDLSAGRGTGGDATRDLYDSIENVIGASFGDVLTGNGSDNSLTGGNGNDTLTGGAGKDTLSGGAGNDALTGGEGADVFIFASSGGTDTVTDFNVYEDVVLLLDSSLSLDDVTVSQVGSDTHISDGAGSLMVLSGIDSSYIEVRLPLPNPFIEELLGVEDPQYALPDLRQPPLVSSGTTDIGSNFTLETDARYASDDYNAFRLDTFVNFTNKGTIWVGNGLTSATGIRGATHTTITNQGQIIAASDNYGIPTGVILGNGNSTLHNEGEIYTFGDANSSAVEVPDRNASSVDVLNDGLIYAWSLGNALGIRGESMSIENNGMIETYAQHTAFGIHAADDTLIVNTGTISSHGVGGSYGIYSNDIDTDATIVIQNSGTIEAAVAIRSYYTGVDITNTGTINGSQYAIFSNTRYATHEEFGFTINNSGTITGDIRLHDDDDEVLNTGTITGDIDLRHGNDVFDTSGGTLIGIVHGGYGRDRIIGSAGNDTLNGGLHDDTLTGGAGADTFVFEDAHYDDVITDFDSDEDTLDLTAVTGINSISDLHAVRTTIDGETGVLLTTNGYSSIFLIGVQLHEFAAATIVN